tara:strand:- start:376 stop:570 length:195 start_codon:yes stop_codon:yes gene_type:complete
MGSNGTTYTSLPFREIRELLVLTTTTTTIFLTTTTANYNYFILTTTAVNYNDSELPYFNYNGSY